MEYLDFEQPIKELRNQLQKTKDIEKETGVDMSKIIREIKKKLIEAKKDIQKNLTPWIKSSAFKTSSAPLHFVIY